jgi:signal transduction histidine kinase
VLEIVKPSVPDSRRRQAPAAGGSGGRAAAAGEHRPAPEAAGDWIALLAGLLPTGAARRDIRAWLFPLAATTIAGVGAGILAAGLPDGAAGASTAALLAAAVALSVVAFWPRIRDLRVVVPALVGLGLCGAGLDWQADGPGFMAAYVSLLGLALRTPRRIALLAGTPVLATATTEQAYDSPDPASAALTVVFGFGLLFITSAFAAISQDARRQAEALLAQEAAAGEAREQAAALAERTRLARDLHDVLTHSLAGLALQLEAARMTAITAGSGSGLVEQITAARRLTQIGMLDARRAVQMLRGDDALGPADVPHLVADTAAVLSLPVTFEADGIPRILDPGAALTLYRVVQESLTNVAKHAGRGARATVRLCWAADAVEVSVVDSGGDSTVAGLPPGGFGLTGMAERAALSGGRLEAGWSGGGFAVRLWLPVNPGPPVRSP